MDTNLIKINAIRVQTTSLTLIAGADPGIFSIAAKKFGVICDIALGGAQNPFFPFFFNFPRFPPLKC